MTDTPSPDAPAADAGDGEARPPSIRVLTQFIKDLSFENPGFLRQTGDGQPEIELGVDIRVEPGPPEDQIFGVDLKLTARAKRPGQEAVVFIAELVYAGVFQLRDARPGDVEPMLLIECPRLLFPFARRVIADVTRDGGHPPLFIDPIDFYGLYRQQRAQAEAQQAEGQA